MSGLKCANCGLMNFATAEVCKRCKLPLDNGTHRAGPGSDSSDGLWHDEGLLVMRVDSVLPARCIKCNSEAGVKHKLVSAIDYSHWKLPLFILGFQIIPRTVMTKLVQQVRVDIALCKKHSSNWSRDLKINLPLIAIGLGLLVISFYLFSWIAAALGILMFATGALSSVIGGDPVYIKRRDAGNIWLKGAGEKYLASLPRFPR